MLRMTGTEAYIAYLRDVRRYSLRTQELYRAALEDFAAFCHSERSEESGEESGEESLAEDLIPSRIRQYEAHLIGRGMKPRTVHLHLSVLSGYCGFLMKEGSLTSNPVRRVRRPKMEKRLPEYYTEYSMEEYLSGSAHAASADELELLRSTAADSKLAKELYNRRLRRLIVNLLYVSGIRRAELIGLQIQSVDYGRQSLRVRGKGDKMREIPLIASILEEISLYLKAASFVTGRERGAGEPLLVTEKGNSLYPTFVDRAVKAELDGSSITGRKSPHVLRHSLATALMEEGADLNAIKEMLGHSSLAATEVYTHNSVQRLKAQYMNAHPRAKKTGRDD